MTRSFVPQHAMSSGEVSPLLHSRPDFQRNQTGLRTCRGFIPQRQGGVTRAPGTIFLGNTKNNAPARLIDFEFAANDACTLEFTTGTMRVWRYGQLVEVGGAPYELATPYGAEAIGRLQWVQSADVVYLVDGVLPIQKLSRFALNNWTIEEFQINNGPFLVQNLDEDKTIHCSGYEGTISLVATGDVFEENHVGSLFRLAPTDYSEIPLWTGNTAVSAGQLMRYGENIYELTSGNDTGVNPPIHIVGEEFYNLGAKAGEGLSLAKYGWGETGYEAEHDESGRQNGTRWRFVSDSTGILRITSVEDANSATAEVIKTIPLP